MDRLPPLDRENRVAAAGVLVCALALAVVSARNWTSWNDSSRLAAVESLVDYHTLAIDHSLYLAGAGGDKLFIDGNYYSDKPLVPSFLLALYYQVLQTCTGLVAHDTPARFAYWMALGGAGLAYVVAVWCIFRLTRVLRLALADRLLLTVSFALATVALAYARQVNNHIMLLAVAAALFLGLARFRVATAPGCAPWPALLGLGSLAGLAYTTDLGAGPVLLAGTVVLIGYRCRSGRALATFALGAAPWLALHHAVNYALGGTFRPVSAVPEFFRWPNCPFRAEDLTGAWNHASLGHFLVYAGEFLVGRRGFFGYNLPLLLAVPGLVALLRRRVAECPELLLGACWAGGTWLVYAVSSTNYSGLCLSIRWLVPLLVPGFLVLALLLRHFPRCRPSFVLLSCWGMLLAALMWSSGTWYRAEVRYFVPIQVAAILSLVAWEITQRVRALYCRRQVVLVAGTKQKQSSFSRTFEEKDDCPV